MALIRPYGEFNIQAFSRIQTNNYGSVQLCVNHISSILNCVSKIVQQFITGIVQDVGTSRNSKECIHIYQSLDSESCKCLFSASFLALKQNTAHVNSLRPNGPGAGILSIDDTLIISHLWKPVILGTIQINLKFRAFCTLDSAPLSVSLCLPKFSFRLQ